ncbi:hypothetical protein CDIK_3916 [Cucumispora dikerogammari]|nr:hypothetical protein CDIK_3916 [Cucumispora dikerogammari]
MEENTNANTQERRIRKTVDIKMLNSIRRFLERGRTTKEISSDENISLRTAYNLIAKIFEDKSNQDIISVAKSRKSRSNETVKIKTVNALQRDCSYTQTELRIELERSNIIRSQSSVSRVLKQMDNTRKKLVKIPEERNLTRTNIALKKYCSAINHIFDNKLVFLDETGLTCIIVKTMDTCQKTRKP